MGTRGGAWRAVPPGPTPRGERERSCRRRVRLGIDRVLEASPALLSDPRYALLSAQSLAEVVISVIVAAELLKQARLDPRRLDMAASWIDRRMVDLEGRTQRIRAGTVDLLDRCERMIAATEV